MEISNDEWLDVEVIQKQMKQFLVWSKSHAEEGRKKDKFPISLTS